jgi:hypothetical protein
MRNFIDKYIDTITAIALGLILSGFAMAYFDILTY